MYKSIVLLSLFLNITFSANHYIRQSASGNADGSDWTNAWIDLPSNFVRGNTYYIADGTYGNHSFNTSEDGTERIYIIKATVSSHGTDVGWDDTFGDGVALFTQASGTNWSVSTGYWTFDGVTGDRNGESNPHGIKLQITTLSNGARNVSLEAGSGSHLIFSHIAMEHAGQSPADGVRTRCVSASTGSANNNTFNYCLFDKWSWSAAVLLRSVFGWTFDYCYFRGAPSGKEAISDYYSYDIIIRYTYFQDCMGTGPIIHRDVHDWSIYGCVFFSTTSGVWTDRVIGNWGGKGEYGYNMKVYNNVFVDNSINRIGWDGDNGIGNNQVYNNIFYGSGTYGYSTFTAHDYNAYSGSNSQGEVDAQVNIPSSIFIDYEGDDFRISGATEPGIILSSPYDMDMDGNTRGLDGTWDRGAFEYTGENAGPLKPQGLRIQKSDP
jgi:hypothetical protein